METFTAIIPAGGLGSRLRPHTFNVPKPMLLMGSAERVIIDSALELASASCTEVLLTTEYLPEPLEGHISEKYAGVTVFRDNRTVGSAGSLLEHYDYFMQLPVEGDTLFIPADHVHEGLSLENYLLSHKSTESDITLLSVRPKSYGEFISIEEGLATAITPFALEDSQSTTGVFILKNSYIKQWLRMQISNGWSGEMRNFYHDIIVPAVSDIDVRVTAFELPEDGYWDDTGTIERYLENNMRLSGGRNVLSAQAEVDESTDLQSCVVLGGVVLKNAGIIRNSIISGFNGKIHITTVESTDCKLEVVGG